MPAPVAAFSTAPQLAVPVQPLTRRARRWRSLFLSDLHLGTSRGRPGHVLDFLAHAEAEAIYLVGDIFDGWNPTARRAGPGADHRMLLTRLERFAAEGTRVVMVPGNHDLGFRRLSGSMIGPMQVCEETHHRLADGRTMLVTHGDSVDPLMALGASIGWAGGKLDILLRRLNQGLNGVRETLGAEASGWVEDQLIRINAAMHPRATYATRLTTRARDLGFQGVICGHYHIPALADLAGVTYANCGDWLDHFSAVTETAEGALELIAWPALAPVPASTRRRMPAGSLPVG